MAKQGWTKAALAEFAVEIRRVDAKIGPFERLCPYELAEEHGVDVYQFGDLAASGCTLETIDYFTSKRPEVWSAALVANGTGRFIIENTAHTCRRRRSNVAHEMAHLLLEHEFDGILFTDGKCGRRDPVTKQMESEATELSGELLLPQVAARRAAIAGKTDDEVAELFDVSIEFARWRMNATGARKIAQRTAAKQTRTVMGR